MPVAPDVVVVVPPPPGTNPVTCMANQYLCVGGIEVANACRTVAYLKNMGHPLLRATSGACCCTDGTYFTPEVDDAPWYDPAMPESADVLGVWLEELSTPTPYARSNRPRQWGGTLSAPRWGPRELHLVGWVYCRSSAATEYAKQWLFEALANVDGLGGVCNLPDAVLYRADSPVVDVDPVTGITRFERTARRVGLIDYKDDVEPTFLACHGFKFDATLSAEVPFLYGPPVTEFDGSVIDPSSPAECNVCNPCPTPMPAPCTCGVMAELMATAPVAEVPLGPATPTITERGYDWKWGANTASPKIKKQFPNGLVADYDQDGAISDVEWLRYKTQISTGAPEIPRKQRGFNWRSMGLGTAVKVIRDLFPNGLIGDYDQDGTISDFEWRRYLYQNATEPNATAAPLMTTRVVSSDGFDDAYCRPVLVRRRFVAIPPTPYWQTATTIITVRVGDTLTPAGHRGLKNLRVAAYQNPLGLTVPQLNDVDYRDYFLCQDPCMTVEVSCLPSGSHLIIDGTTRQATVNCGGAPLSAYGYLSSSGGSAFQWPEFSCTGLMLVLESDADNTPSDATMQVQYVPRDRR